MSSSYEARQLTEIAALLHADQDAPVTEDRIVQQAVDLLPETESASLTIRSHGKYKSPSATTSNATRLDELQYELNEGPCLEAATEYSWLRSGDVAHDHRWPRWGPRAAEMGARSVLSVRLLTQDKPIGAVNFYSGRTGAFIDRDHVDLAVLFATHAALALSSAQLVTGLQTAVSSRHSIGMAQGILIERYKIDPEEAFNVLRRLSSIHNWKVRELAEHIVTTREVPLSTAPRSLP